MISPLQNDRGIADLYLIALLLGVTIGLLGLSQYSIQLSKMSNRVRVRAHMAQVKTTVELLLRSPTSYTCSNNGGASNCVLTTGNVTSAFSGFEQRLDNLMGALPGESCLAGVTCGLFIVQPATLVSLPGESQPRVQMVIGYRGQLGSGVVYPMALDLPVPVEVIQNSAYHCDTYFDGFNPDGSVHCKVMNFSRAPAGKYIRKVYRDSFKVEFGSLPTNVSDCANGNRFTIGYNWTGDAGYTTTCGQRIDPFLLN